MKNGELFYVGRKTALPSRWFTSPRGIKWYGSLGVKTLDIPATGEHPRRRYDFEFIREQRANNRIVVRVIKIVEKQIDE